MSGETKLKQAIDLVTRAVEEDMKKNYAEAVELYHQFVGRLLYSIKYDEHSDQAKVAMHAVIDQFMAREEKLRKHLLKEKSKEKPSKIKYDWSRESDSEVPEEKLQSGLLKGAIVMEKPNVKWSDIAGLDSAKESLKEAILLPIKFPQLFSGKRKPFSNILLFGLPGTGKTCLVKAVATEASQSTLFLVSSSGMLSKWQGKSERTVSRLLKEFFDLVKQHKPSIILVEDIEHLRSSQWDDESAKFCKTEFLIQLQFITRISDIFVLGATNVPWLLDSPILRRFDRLLYIDLPDETSRQTIFKLHMEKIPNILTEHDFRYLAKKTEGFSGGDIVMLVHDALMQPVHKIYSATHFCKVRSVSREDPNVIVDDFLTPCSASTPRAIEMSCKDVPCEKLLEPALSMDDMMLSLKSYMLSRNKEDVLKLISFAKDFSSQGLLRNTQLVKLRQ